MQHISEIIPKVLSEIVLKRCRLAYVEYKEAQKQFAETEDFSLMDIWVKKHSEYLLELTQDIREGRKDADLFDLVAEIKARKTSATRL